MESQPPFPKAQLNQHHCSQTQSPCDSQSFSQLLQYDSQFFSQQYPFNPQFPPNSLNSQIVGSQSQISTPHLHKVCNLQQSAVKKKKITQNKERSPNWTKDEDEALCRAWLQISEDAITGSDQPRQRLWDRILHEFDKILGHDTNRPSTALMNRWSILQSHLNKYSGFVQLVKRYPTSGCNVEDSIGALDKLYYDDQGHPFKWYSCWLLLKDSPKWFNYTKEQEAKKQKISRRKRSGLYSDVDDIGDSPNPSTPATTPSSINLEDDDIPPINQPGTMLDRPPGRKAAKNIRKNNNVDQVKAINLFAKGFDNLIKDQKEISEKEINMTNERERMKIEAKKDRELMRIQAKQEQERMKFEKEIMMTDPSSIPTEEGKAWIIAQQKTIWKNLNQEGHGHDSSGSRP